MAKYRKKPVVIEAVQYIGPNFEALPPWLPTNDLVREGDSVLIVTLEGTMRCSPGDYLIRGVKGELYPCKPDIFEATYEKCTE